MSKSRKLSPLITLNVTSIKRSPLLSGRGHLLQSPKEGISIVFWPVLSGHFMGKETTTKRASKLNGLMT